MGRLMMVFALFAGLAACGSVRPVDMRPEVSALGNADDARALLAAAGGVTCRYGDTGVGAADGGGGPVLAFEKWLAVAEAVDESALVVVLRSGDAECLAFREETKIPDAPGALNATKRRAGLALAGLMSLGIPYRPPATGDERPVLKIKPTLGIGVSDGAGGVFVGTVEAGGIGAAAGIKVGDLITAFAGTEVLQIRQLAPALKRHQLGTWVPVRLNRNGQSLSAIVKYPPGRLEN